MVKHIELLNSRTGKTMQMGYGDKDEIYIIDNIDWGVPEIDMQSYRVPFQTGETLSGSSVGSRPVTMFGYVISRGVSPYGKTWDEYYKEQEENIEEHKLMLDDFISIFDDVIITAGEYNLISRPVNPPKYSTTYEENNEVLCAFSLEFRSYEPMFYKKQKTVALAVTEKRLHFPLPLYPAKTVFGEIKRQQTVLVSNIGNVSTGCEIKIEAQGGNVTNPKVYNVLTGEFIEFKNTVIENGDYILINTNTGEEDVYKHNSKTGENISVIGDMITGSDFLQIPRGESYFGYNVLEEEKNNVNMFITFTEKFFNMRGM